MKKVYLLLCIIFSFNLIGCDNREEPSQTQQSPSFVEVNKTVDLGEIEDVKNVILLVGDGMGQEHIKAGEIYKGEKLYLQGFPHKALVKTSPMGYGITDSAAAATAMATGVKTNKGIVGKDEWLNDLETIMDVLYKNGKSTGILTTEQLVGATPMGFSGHAEDRNSHEELLNSAAKSSNVNLFMGHTFSQEYKNIFIRNGYKYISDADDISTQNQEKIIATFNIDASKKSMQEDENSVAFDRLVVEALEYLSKNEDGFFLMAEGAHIDHGAHDNDMQYMLKELFAFDLGVKAAVEWGNNRNDTVVLVVADHETGGLRLKDGINKTNFYQIDKTGSYINFSWSTTGHTGADVLLMVNGKNISFENYSMSSSRRIDNTDIFYIVKDLMIKSRG